MYKTFTLLTAMSATLAEWSSTVMANEFGGMAPSKLEVAPDFIPAVEVSRVPTSVDAPSDCPNLQLFLSGLTMTWPIR